MAIKTQSSKASAGGKEKGKDGQTRVPRRVQSQKLVQKKKRKSGKSTGVLGPGGRKKSRKIRRAKRASSPRIVRKRILRFRE